MGVNSQGPRGKFLATKRSFFCGRNSLQVLTAVVKMASLRSGNCVSCGEKHLSHRVRMTQAERTPFRSNPTTLGVGKGDSGLPASTSVYRSAMGGGGWVTQRCPSCAPIGKKLIGPYMLGISPASATAIGRCFCCFFATCGKTAKSLRQETLSLLTSRGAALAKNPVHE